MKEKNQEFTEAERTLCRELFGVNNKNTILQKEPSFKTDRATFKVGDAAHNDQQLDELMPLKTPKKKQTNQNLNDSTLNKSRKSVKRLEQSATSNNSNG